jgi:hypothetical protein
MLGPMLPIVAIEVQAPPPGVEARGELNIDDMLAACTRALSEARCALEDDANGSYLASAVVTWSSETDVTIEVGDAVAARETWTRRSLHFEPGDDARERWRSVGLTTALLAGDRKPDAVPAPPGGIAVDGVLLTGTGLLQAARFGAGLGVELQAFDSPVWFAGRVDYALAQEAPPELRIDWLTFGLGLNGVFALAPDVAFELGVEGLAQNVTASATKGKELDEASQWLPGGRLRAGFVWPASRSWAGIFRAEGCLFDAPTTITRDGKDVAEIPRAAVALGFGIRYRP